MLPSFRCVSVFACACLCRVVQDKEGRATDQKGDPSNHGGTATVREPYTPKQDDSATSNDESNDHPLGHFGSVTLYAYNSSSGHTYTLDADVENGEFNVYIFQRADGVDFDFGEIDSDGNGRGTDENGRFWVRGLASGSIDADDHDTSARTIWQLFYLWIIAS
jgi:hypothetical protein